MKLISAWCLSLLFVGVLGIPQVRLGQTTINGLTLPLLKEEFFGGIPFAQPPIGDLRFRPPQFLQSPTAQVLNATDFGPPCPQVGAPNVSEDCLTINVWRPAGVSDGANLPVMLWVYGGGFLTGASLAFNGSILVSRSISRGTPIIYVNFNYRLGALGFPQGQEAQTNGVLNLGLKDQLAAMQWVQDNIGKFGGDKTKVTLFGESAGAISLAMLFLNSNIQNFARAAIFESGSQSSNRLFPPDRDAPFFQTLAEAVPECNGAASENVFQCLRRANVSSILEAQATVLASTEEFFPFGPVIDGPGGVIPDIPSKLLAEGQFTKLPFISGTNKDEGTIFVSQSINSTDQIVNLLTTINLPEYTGGPAELSTAIDTLLALYPDIPALGSPFGTGNETFGLSPVFKRSAAILGDLFFLSTRRQWINAASSNGVPTFGYHFTDSQGDQSLGVSHGSEIPYVYGDLSSSASPTAQELSLQMSDYWLSFAVSLDPNDGKGQARANWPRFTSQNQFLLQLDGQSLVTVPDNFRQMRTNFINSIPLVFHH